MSDTEYFTVAEVVTPDGYKRSVRCRTRPANQEFNLLFVLCEHTNRILSIDDICRRLKRTPNAIAILACRLRKKLFDDWAIETVKNQGMRIMYIGGELADAPKTKLVIDFDAIQRRRRWHRHTIESRIKMSEAAVRNKAHERFRITKA